MAGIREKTEEYKQANFFMIAAGSLLLLYIYLLVCLYPFLIKGQSVLCEEYRYGNAEV